MLDTRSRSKHTKSVVLPESNMTKMCCRNDFTSTQQKRVFRKSCFCQHDQRKHIFTVLACSGSSNTRWNLGCGTCQRFLRRMMCSDRKPANDASWLWLVFIERLGGVVLDPPSNCSKILFCNASFPPVSFRGRADVAAGCFAPGKRRLPVVHTCSFTWPVGGPRGNSGAFSGTERRPEPPPMLEPSPFENSKPTVGTLERVAPVLRMAYLMKS